MTRKSLPRKLEKTVYQQFRSRCPFCGEDDVNTLQVHHIVAHAKMQSHHIENLLLTCANCHQKIENGMIEMRAVYAAIKREFGANWDHIPVSAFNDLVAFLQRRIDGTRLGKAKKAQGKLRYSSFEQHRSKAVPR